MKKLFAIASALFLLTSTSGLVFAQGSATPASTPTVKKVQKKKVKKMKKAAAPVSTPSTTAPVSK